MKNKFPVSFLTLILVVVNLLLPLTVSSYSVAATPISQSVFANTDISNPYEMDYDSSGNIYISDGSNEVRKYGSSGTFITQFGSGATGVAVASNGDIIVANYQQDKIDIFSSSGTFISSFGSFGSGNDQFYAPYAVAVDSQGNLYVADAYNNRIQKFNSSYTYVSTITGNSGAFDFPEMVAVDGSDNFYVLDSGNNRVQKFTSSGTFVYTITGNSGAFDYPEGMAVDPDGNVFVSDSGNARIQVFDSSGNFAVQLGSSGSGLGQFLYPIGLLWVPSSNSLLVGADAEVEKWTFDRTDAVITINDVGGEDITNDSTPVITGTATDALTNITAVEISVDGGSFVACTADDGAFNEQSENFTCSITQTLTNELHQIIIRSTDSQSNTNSGDTLESYNFNVDTGYSAPGNDTDNPNPETDYQIPQTGDDGNAPTDPITPSGDSDTGGQDIVVIIDEGTLDNDAFLLANVTPVDELINTTDGQVSNGFEIADNILGFYTSPETVAVQVGGIQEIWYMTYPPAGSDVDPARIIPELQDKPSILSLSYLDSYLFFPGSSLNPFSPSSLALAFSSNGDFWKIIPQSIVDATNKTVSALQKIGGYYTIVSLQPRFGRFTTYAYGGTDGELSTSTTPQKSKSSLLSPTTALKQIGDLRDRITQKFSFSIISGVVDMLMNPFIRYGLMTILLTFFFMILFIIHRDKKEEEDNLTPKEFNHENYPVGYGINWPNHKPRYQ